MASDWNGVPDKPHDDGWHWVKTRHGIASDRPRHWWGSIARWELSDGTLIEPAECTDGWCYLGPCLTPADHAAAVEAAVQAERRACLQHAVDAIPTANPPRTDGYGNHVAGERYAAEHIASRIRARGPADALAAAIAKAREDALRDAARIAQDRESEGGEYAMAARHIAVAIRALAGKEQGK